MFSDGHTVNFLLASSTLGFESRPVPAVHLRGELARFIAFIRGLVLFSLAPSVLSAGSFASVLALLLRSFHSPTSAKFHISFPRPRSLSLLPPSPSSVETFLLFSTFASLLRVPFGEKRSDLFPLPSAPFGAFFRPQVTKRRRRSERENWSQRLAFTIHSEENQREKGEEGGIGLKGDLGERQNFRTKKEENGGISTGVPEDPHCVLQLSISIQEISLFPTFSLSPSLVLSFTATFDE